MSRRTAFINLAILLGLSWAVTGCLGAGDDPYSEVAQFCMTQDPGMGTYYATETGTYLTPECRRALDPAQVERERIRASEGREASVDELPHFLPYDEESFKNAPFGFRDKVTEAFQALIAYPLAIPEDNAIFGATSGQIGVVPLDFLEIFHSFDWKNLNQALFNYVFNNIDIIKYEPVLSGGSSATHSPRISGQPLQLTLAHQFWDPHSNFEDNIRNPFGRAALLAHEARHGDGFAHIECEADKAPTSGFECDAELGGPYGFQAIYYKYLLHGSATCKATRPGQGCRPPLDVWNVMLIGSDMCRILNSRIMTLYPELVERLGNIDDCQWLTYNEVMALEGIPLPPSGDFSVDIPGLSLDPSPQPSPSPTIPPVSQ